jgi:hypothetical protein
MLEFAYKSTDNRQDVVEDILADIAARIEMIRHLAANSEIGGEAEGHEISHQCKQILSRISALH